MIASLPMYDRPETRAAYDRLWTRIRDELRLLWAVLPDIGSPLPAALAHDPDPWDHWRAPDLILSQTCGLPYRSELHANVILIGTPDYHLPGCRPGYYNSVFVMRAESACDDPAGWSDLMVAVNDGRSQSGWAAPQDFMETRDLSFHKTSLTGSHRNSAHAVANGTADIAAIDAQTWRMIRRWDRWSDTLVEVARTEETPGLPLISAMPDGRNDLHFAVSRHLANLPAKDAAILDIRSLVSISKADYLAVPTPKAVVK